MNNNQPKKRKILKFFLVGLGTVAILLLSIIGLGTRLFPDMEANDITAYHPFRSAEAKEQYLALYDMRAKKWPITSETMIVSTSYGQTFVRISGPSTAPPLVLLHGMGGNSLQWLPNIEALSESYRTYAVDNIYDNGRSVYTRAIQSPEDFVNWLDELFSALKLRDDINLIGLSYGGWITSQYALRYPKRLNRIVLLAPAGTVLPLSFKWIVRAVLCAVPHKYFTKSFLYWLLSDLASKDDAGRAFIEEHADESYLALRSFKAKRMVNPTVLTDAELQNIKVPTLYLVGENEKIYSAQKAKQRLNDIAPHIKAEILPNAGHDLTIVQKETVNKKILEFLRYQK